jgi:surface antigen
MRAAIALSAALALAAAAPAAQAQSSPLSSIFSCSASGGKQEAGAVIGGVVGGLLGSQVSKNERGLGTVVGAAIGAAAGSWIGCRMQSTDQARAQRAMQDALDKGQSQSWNNPQTGASGQVNIVSTSYGPPVAGASMRFAPGVQTLASYDSMKGLYAASSQVNLRAGPSTHAAVLGKLSAGEPFDALGKVPGQPWVLAGRYGQAIGYVAESLVRPQDYRTAEASCRVVDQTINAPGYGSTTERYNACRGAGGQWQVTRV